jgi:FixJ family two-component response regulator
VISRARDMVYIVDDDASVRQSLARLARSAGYDAGVFSSANEFLKSPLSTAVSCLVLDIRMPGMDGLSLQEKINSMEERRMPVVFISGHGDVPISVNAMKAGAVDFLSKPFNDDDLLNAIRSALQKARQTRDNRGRMTEVKKRLDTLTPREKEVLRWVVAGMLNKQVAGKLGIAEKTVKVHRGRVMQKMKVQSFAELVRVAQEAGVKYPVPAV